AADVRRGRRHDLADHALPRRGPGARLAHRAACPWPYRRRGIAGPACRSPRHARGRVPDADEEHPMRLVFAHARAMTVELFRYPAFSVPTLGFPALFFLLFVSSWHDRNATVLLASFAGFALLTVALFQFGVGVAAERETPWEQFLRTLPV